VLRRLSVRRAAEEFFRERVMGPIHLQLARALEAFREGREKGAMRAEDLLAARFEHHRLLQTALRSMNALLYAVKLLLARASPALSAGPNAPPRATYAFSWASIRAQQLGRHPALRAEPAALARLWVPRVRARGSVEGVGPDLDLALFSHRFVRDSLGLKWKGLRARREAQEAAAQRSRAQAVLRQLRAR